jgi:hypothetical protein
VIIPKTRATAFGICAAAILAGCAGPNASSIAPAGSNGVGMAQTTTGQRSYFAGARPLANAPAHARRFKQWMEPAAKNDRLLYVSDFYANVVQVYRYPAHGSPPPVGTLTGLTNPQGMCVDKAQNVYIATTGTAQILEYAHGGTTPIATYEDPNEFPVGCAVNPTNHDVAAGNIFGTSGNGSVTVFHKGTATTYSDPNVAEMFFPAFDPRGNLFIGGLSSSGSVQIDELPAGGSALTELTLKGTTLPWPGPIQWDGTFLAVGGQATSGSLTIYRTKLSHKTLTVEQSVELGGVGVAEWYIKSGAKGVVGADPLGLSVNTWPYPAGGPYEPRKHLILTGAAEPIGTVISVGKK